MSMQTNQAEEVRKSIDLTSSEHQREAAYNLEELLSSEGDSEYEDPKTKKLDQRPKYRSVSNEKRAKLIKVVMENGKRIKTAAKRLGINYSTAKSICQAFKKEGRTEKKDPYHKIPKEKKAAKAKRVSTECEADTVEGQTHQGPNKTQESTQKQQAKTKTDRPCHDAIETRSMRKKVKMTSDANNKEVGYLPKRMEDIKSFERVKKEPEISQTKIDDAKTTYDLVSPNKVTGSTKDTGKKESLPSTLSLPLIESQQSTHKLLLGQHLQQIQRSLLATANQQNQMLSQFYTHQAPQLAIQRLNQVLPGPNMNYPLKSLIQSQELQILNKIYMNNIILGRLGTAHNIQYPQRSNFF